MLVEPRGQALLVVEAYVLAAVGQHQLGRPVGVLAQHGRVDVHVVGYVVQYDIHAVGVRRIEHRAQLGVGAETLVDSRVIYRPVAVIARELWSAGPR